MSTIISQSNRTEINWANLAVLLLSLAVVAGVGVEGWLASRQALSGADAAPGSGVTLQASPTPLPSLLLNAEHHRQGDTVAPDSANLGKTNPFQ